MNILRDTEAAYLAGLLDGEGYIGLPRIHTNDGQRTATYHLKIEICNNCIDVLQWVIGVTGCGSIQMKNRNADSRLHGYAWRLPSSNGHEFLTQLLPFLKIKRLQAEVALEFSKTLFPKYGSRGKLTDEIIELREGMRKRIITLNSKYRSGNVVKLAVGD